MALHLGLTQQSATAAQCAGAVSKYLSRTSTCEDRLVAVADPFNPNPSKHCVAYLPLPDIQVWSEGSGGSELQNVAKPVQGGRPVTFSSK
jgi:hypothetical protein